MWMPEQQSKIQIIWAKIVDALLEEKASGKTWQQIGDTLGVHSSTVMRWAKQERGGQKNSYEDIVKYAERLGIPVAEKKITLADDNFTLIPHVKARLGAGYSLETSDDVDGLLAFKNEFVNHIGHKKNLVLMDVCGESMEPTIADGDTVLVDLSDKKIIQNFIYAIRIGNEISIKRLEPRPVKILRIKSDNPLVENYNIKLDEIDGQFAVIGRVRWRAGIL